MKIEYIQKCKCGAVTIRFDNSASNSMFWETFEKLDLDTGDATWLHQSLLLRPLCQPLGNRFMRVWIRTEGRKM